MLAVNVFIFSLRFSFINEKDKYGKNLFFFNRLMQPVLN